MKNIKALIILPIISITLISVSSLFAAKIDRNVYAIYSETYTGAYIGNSGDVDAMNLDKWSRDGSVSSASENEGVLEGDSFTRFTIDKSEGWEVFVYHPYVSKKMNGFYNGSVKFLARVESKNSAFLSAKVGVQLSTSKHVTKTLGGEGGLGLVADGEWHEITIPLDSSFGISSENELNDVIGLFTFQPTTLTVGKYMDIDNIRWVRDNVGTFDVTLKNIDGDTTASKITWDQDVFRTGWKAAKQYVDFDLDQDTKKSWSVRIYTNNNTGNENAGLVATVGDKQVLLPMCWRINKRFLPSDEGSLNIAYTEAHVEQDEKGNWNTEGLYDVSKGRFWHPWFYFVDSSNTEFNSKYDYMTVWSYKGFHADDGGAYWGMSDMNTNGGMIAPKLYFGANFEKAVGGTEKNPVTFTSQIKVDFINE